MRSVVNLVSDCLTSGKSSRFYKRLVYDDQIATDAAASVDLREIGGQFRVQATARPGQNLAQVEKELDEELARFLKDGPTPEELQRVKAQYQANFIRGIERIGGFGGKSDRLAQSQVFRGSPDAYKVSLKRVQEATADDLKSAANRWLSDGVYILEVHPFPDYKAATTGADRSKAPEPGTPPELKLPKLQRATLSNGLKVIVAERHEVPLVDFTLAADAGFAADSLATPGTANLAMRLLTYGAPSVCSSSSICREVVGVGAAIFRNVPHFIDSRLWHTVLHDLPVRASHLCNPYLLMRYRRAGRNIPKILFDLFFCRLCIDVAGQEPAQHSKGRNTF